MNIYLVFFCSAGSAESFQKQETENAQIDFISDTIGTNSSTLSVRPEVRLLQSVNISGATPPNLKKANENYLTSISSIDVAQPGIIPPVKTGSHPELSKGCQ